MIRDMSKIVVLLTFVALNVFDVLTTNHVLSKGGWEANPLMALDPAVGLMAAVVLNYAVQV